MRDNLKRKIENDNSREVVVFAEIGKYGTSVERKVTKKGHVVFEKKNTILLTNIVDENGYLLTDHSWVTLNNTFNRNEIIDFKKTYKVGDNVKINCEIGYYIRKKNQSRINKYGIKIECDLGISKLISGQPLRPKGRSFPYQRQGLPLSVRTAVEVSSPWA